MVRLCLPLRGSHPFSTDASNGGIVRTMSGNGSSSNSNAYHQTRVPDLYAATITLAVLQTIAVVARFAARKISAANFWWDDYTIVLALVRPTTSFLQSSPETISTAYSSSGPEFRALRLLLGSNSDMQFWASHSGIWRPCYRGRPPHILQSKHKYWDSALYRPFDLLSCSQSLN